MHDKTIRKCSDCGKELAGHGNPKRCMRCAALLRYIEKNGKPPERIIAKCAVCEKEFTDYASNRTKKKMGVYFCSPECRATWVGINNSVSRGGNGSSEKPETDKFYYRNNSDTIREKSKERYRKNRDKILEKLSLNGRKLKQRVMNAYGGKCECCGEDAIEFLTIDHVNNNGAEHRRQVGKGRKIYTDIVKNDFPKNMYRVLCFNCNISRGFYGYCPHKLEEKTPTSHVPRVPGRKRTVK